VALHGGDDLSAPLPQVKAVDGLTQGVLVPQHQHHPETVFLNFYGAQEPIPRNRFRHGPCSLAGQYDNPVPTRFLVPIASMSHPSTITAL
jgi:hypothetical protein